MAAGTSRTTSRAERLVGRAADLARAGQLLAEHSLVTVTGVGGVGKTSLAVAAAAARADRTVFCGLSDVETGDGVRHLVAARLGTALPAGAPLGQALPPLLDDSGVLVLLDNCEHVIDAAAEVAEELAGAGPHVTVLATSREPLRLATERVLVLGPLAVPASADDADASTRDAVVLFADRAKAVRDDFRLDDETLPYVVDICRALDGLPLALEIAAARVRSLAVRDIAARLGERFSLLAGERRGRPARHHGLRAVVAWSYDLLTQHERALFDELSVYPNADLEAATAAAVAVGVPEASALDVLDGLVAKSLLVADTTAGATRYRMLETVRAYGVERLTERGTYAETRSRHADRYTELATWIRTTGLSEWSAALAVFIEDYDNFRTALGCTLAHDETPDRSYRLLAPLWYIGLQYRSADIAELGTRALERWPEDGHPLRAEVRATTAACLLAVEDMAGATRLATEAIRAGTSQVATAWAEATLAGVAMHARNDPDAALDHLSRADTAAAAAGFEPFRCDLLGRRTAVLAQAGRHDEALDNAHRALAMAAEQRNVFEHAWSLHLVGQLLAVDEPATGREWLLNALAEATRIGYPYGIASSLRGLGVAATGIGETAEAARRLRDALDRFVRTGFRLERWNTLAATLPLLLSTGRRVLAADVMAAVERSGVVVERIAAPDYDAAREELRAGHDAIATGPADEERLLVRVRDELAAIAAGAATPAGAAVPEQRQDEGGARLRRQGGLWRVTYAGTTAVLPDLKGLADLAVLLGRPGSEVPALDLAAHAGATAGQQAAAYELEGTPGDLGEQVDATARAAYAARIRELQEELDDADAAGDPERSTRAREELDTLTRHLSAAYGLHGPRRSGDPAEKARTAVTARIRAAITKVDEVHPELGRHLRHSVRTGRFCVYRPDDPVAWQVEP